MAPSVRRGRFFSAPMPEKVARRFLVVAVLLSMLIHLAGGGLVHWPTLHKDEVPERVSLTKRFLVQIRRVVTPSPLVRPRAAQKPVGALAHRPTAKINPPAVANTRKGGASHGVRHAVAVAPAQRPTMSAPAIHPSSTMRPSLATCTTANQSAGIVDPVPPVISKSAREPGTHGVARVHVTLSETAAIIDAKVVESSQNRELDLEALAAARASVYRPATLNCKPVPGEADYVVEFVPL